MPLSAQWEAEVRVPASGQCRASVTLLFQRPGAFCHTKMENHGLAIEDAGIPNPTLTPTLAPIPGAGLAVCVRCLPDSVGCLHPH